MAIQISQNQATPEQNKEPIKEFTPLEKLQAEYNQTCAQLGHARSQIIMLSEDEVSLQERIKKIRNKLNNLPKDKQNSEVTNGTESQTIDC